MNALCPGCGDTVALTQEQIEARGTKGWWHPECHEVATANVNRISALRWLAKSTGYVERPECLDR